MRNYAKLIFILIYSSSIFAGEVVVDFFEYSTYSNDHIIDHISEVRGQLAATTRGSFFNKKCFKEYYSNYPDKPTTVSYLLKENIVFPIIGKKRISLGDLRKTYNDAKSELLLRLGKECKTSDYLLVLIKGKTKKGHSFKSDFYIEFDKDKLTLISGIEKYELSDSSPNESRLTPTTLLKGDWDSVWRELEFKESGYETNF
ncbi:hypothetical protein ABMA79_12135 [Halobacteriovorax sp. HFRX-2_2]|uniref:hypothetical protein n=1 Tax=unclassified Halobacteriovorax TaxID=2639665 RepID=UPI00371432A0